MKILFLTARVPYPPDRGDRITTHHFLRHFQAQGARLRLGCFAEDDRDLESAAMLSESVEEICAPRIWRKGRKIASLRGIATGEALTLPYFRHRRLKQAVDRWMKEDPPDLIYFYSSSMGLYGLDHAGPLRLMLFAELDSDKWRQYAARRVGVGRWVYDREARTLVEFERRVAREFDASFVVSDVERELFLEYIPDVEPIVLPNGVDVDHFCSAGEARREPHTVVFTGVMDYEPNVDAVQWFARECFPALRERFPDARFLIVGSRPRPEVQRLAALPGIEVTGRVEETPPWFDRAAVAVAPIRVARGLQNKVLEAMSMGLPVVATPQAFQGLGARPDDVGLSVDDAQSMLECVSKLFAEPGEARRSGERAAAWVREVFRWESVFAKFDAVVEQKLAER